MSQSPPPDTVEISRTIVNEIGKALANNADILERLNRRTSDAERDVTLGSVARELDRLRMDHDRIEIEVMAKDGLLVRTTELAGQVINLSDKMSTLAISTNEAIKRLEISMTSMVAEFKNEVAAMSRATTDITLEDKRSRTLILTQWIIFAGTVAAALITLWGVLKSAH